MSVRVRNPIRNQKIVLSERVTKFWKKNTAVSVPSIAASTPISTVFSRQMRCQSAVLAAASSGVDMAGGMGFGAISVRKARGGCHPISKVV